MAAGDTWAGVSRAEAGSTRCWLGQSDSGGRIPFGPPTSEGPAQGGHCFRCGPWCGTRARGAAGAGRPPDSRFSDVPGLTALSGNERFSVKTTAGPLTGGTAGRPPKFIALLARPHTWGLPVCPTSDVGGALGGGEHRGEGSIQEALCVESKKESVDSEFRISKEGEVSRDGSLVLTKVMKREGL